MRVLQYCFGEAAASLWRGRRSGIMSVLTSAAAIFVLGALLLVTNNVERIIGRWEAAAELVAYVSDDVSDEQQAAIRDLLDSSSVAESYTSVSKAEAFRRFRQDFSDLASVIGGLDENPLPASYDVRLRADPDAGDAVGTLAERLRGIPGVTDVRYDREWITRIAIVVSLLRGLGTLVVVTLVVAAALTVANVVRLAGHARRGELEIMRLVGAPVGYVRGPFIVEGMLHGGLGSTVALAVLWGAFLLGEFYYGPLIATLLNASRISFLPLELSALLVVGGLVVGTVGGVVGAQRTARL